MSYQMFLFRDVKNTIPSQKSNVTICDDVNSSANGSNRNYLRVNGSNRNYYDAKTLRVQEFLVLQEFLVDLTRILCISVTSKGPLIHHDTYPDVS